MKDLSSRSTQEVLDDHLRESRDGSIEDDLARNYAEALVVLTSHGVYRGHDGLRSLNQLLREEFPTRPSNTLRSWLREKSASLNGPPILSRPG